MKSLIFGIVGCWTVLAVTAASAAELKWSGMRLPCKVSAGDGVTNLGTKIGTFTTLSKEESAQAIASVNRRFPDSRPWATWAVGVVPDAAAVTDAAQEEALTHLDKLGVDIYLELYPRKTNTNVVGAIDEWLGKLKHHSCVKGFGVDLEYYKRVDDATAKSWDETIKAHNPKYRMFLKHWQAEFMPPSYRGRGDLIFICTSSEETVNTLNDGFAKWATQFAPTACAFQIGYPADEDGMDGRNTGGWWKLSDPIKDWGTSLLAKIENPKQEIGLLWVAVKSGKTYNTSWDLTKLPAPGPKSAPPGSPRN
jgi:hypothetical protein